MENLLVKIGLLLGLFALFGCNEESASGSSGGGLSTSPSGLMQLSESSLKSVLPVVVSEIAEIADGSGFDFGFGLDTEDDLDDRSLAFPSSSTSGHQIGNVNDVRTVIDGVIHARTLMTRSSDPCDSGSMSVNGDTVTYNKCRFNLGDGDFFELNGKVTNTELVDSSVACSDGFTDYIDTFSVAAKLQGFSVTVRSEGVTSTIRTEADMRIDDESNDCTESSSSRISGDHVVLSFDGLTTGVFSFDMLNESDSDGDYVTYGARVDHHSLSGSVQVSTLERLEFNYGVSDHPIAGVIKLTGSGGTSVTVTIHDSAPFLALELDVNGNGTVDCDVSASWEDLEAGDWACP